MDIYDVVDVNKSKLLFFVLFLPIIFKDFVEISGYLLMKFIKKFRYNYKIYIFIYNSYFSHRRIIEVTIIVIVDDMLVEVLI